MPVKNIYQSELTLTFILLGLIILLFVFVPLIVSSDFGVSWGTMLDKQVRNTIWLMVYTALIVTAVSLIFGVPLAYILARYSFPGRRIVEGIIDVPIVVPYLAAGILFV
ncbi:MAG: hypothetical protein SVM79_03955 [Chloroflexota bacterium]|nr:hypothetical protein [Chloroflexota bacterium]